MGTTDYYDIFGLPKNATQEQIKSRYRTLVLKYHPDKNKSVYATMRMTEINLAYEILSDPQKREIYDKDGLDGVYERYNEEDLFGRRNYDYYQNDYEEYRRAKEEVKDAYRREGRNTDSTELRKDENERT